MRLFIAVWPVPAAAERIREIRHQASLQVVHQALRWVSPAKLHATLRFLGDVPDDRTEGIVAALRTVQNPSFDLQTSGLGGFPSLYRPKVVWLGLEGPLAGLAAAVDRALEVEAEEEFVPHITLARVNPGSKQVGAKVRDVPPEMLQPAAHWHAAEFTLVETLPSGDYRVVETFPLGSEPGTTL